MTSQEAVDFVSNFLSASQVASDAPTASQETMATKCLGPLATGNWSHIQNCDSVSGPLSLTPSVKPQAAIIQGSGTIGGRPCHQVRNMSAAASALAHEVLERAASQRQISVPDLMQLDKGKRRRVFDDLTIIVVDLQDHSVC